MRRTFAALAVAATLILSRPAAAQQPVYIALGDSITFGETDLRYIPSLGDRGYVSLFADTLAARSGGDRPAVINLAIDGETADSFLDGTGRTPPVVGRTDVPLALQNLNYNPTALVPQSALFRSTVAAQQPAGNRINTVSISLGFNELVALASPPPSTALAQVEPTLAAYRANYSAVLTQVRTLLPNTDLFLLNYFNPFPADPGNPAGPIFAQGGTSLNNTIRDLAGQFGAFYVDTFFPFVGNEAAYTFLDEFPTGSVVPPPTPFGNGVAPIGKIHPNAAGYQVIAAQVAAAQSAAAIPEPSSLVLLLGAGGAVLVLGSIRRRSA